MKWQQIAMIVWLAIDVAGAVLLDGEEKKGEYRALPMLITALLLGMILYTGGFWN